MCLNSIKSQTFVDFEVILIGDVLTNSGQKVCNDFNKNDTRFRVIFQNNSGIASLLKGM